MARAADRLLRCQLPPRSSGPTTASRTTSWWAGRRYREYAKAVQSEDPLSVDDDAAERPTTRSGSTTGVHRGRGTSGPAGTVQSSTSASIWRASHPSRPEDQIPPAHIRRRQTSTHLDSVVESFGTIISELRTGSPIAMVIADGHRHHDRQAEGAEHTDAQIAATPPARCRNRAAAEARLQWLSSSGRPGPHRRAVSPGTYCDAGSAAGTASAGWSRAPGR